MYIRKKRRKNRLYIVPVCAVVCVGALMGVRASLEDNSLSVVSAFGRRPVANAIYRPETEIIEKIDNINIAESAEGDWALALVNGEKPMEEGYEPELVGLKNGLEIDKRIENNLNEMLAQAKKEGYSIVVCSAYRSVQRQTELFEKEVAKQMKLGKTREQAESEASQNTAKPGTSEHSLGLAVDLVSLKNQILDEKQANTAENKWLMENCASYGFILRFPKDKTEITGVIYEPWHFRYVGVSAAKEIMELGICLEEYLDVGSKARYSNLR